MSTAVDPIPRTGPRPDETSSLPEIGGIEITGLDLSRPLSRDRKDWLIRTFRAHPVIVFRDQRLTKDQQHEFTLNFGEIEGLHVNRHIDAAKYAPVHTVSNIGRDGEPAAPSTERGNYFWHSDKSYHDVPSLMTMLHGVEIPPRGGETQFANTAMAYAALDEPTRVRLGGLRAVHSWERSRIQSGSQPATEEQKRERPPVDHPVVRTHPETGAKALYLGNHASHILGWPEAEGRALLRGLEALATRPAFVWTHRWRVGDLVMWDNRCTLHRALPHENMDRERRVLHRTVVRGTVPY
jgi:alpha-ketoglutarate-dependent 2,4-dichlorophenoxyacetate dioxygenase